MDQLIRSLGRLLRFSMIAALFLGLPTATALAQTDTTETPVEEPSEIEPGTVRLVTQTASVQSDGTVNITVDWDGEVRPDLFLGALFHQRIESEREVGAPIATVLNRQAPIPLTEVATDPDGNLVLAIPIRSVSSGETDRVYLPGPGVYPFTVEVRSSRGLISSVSSTVVRLPQDTETLTTLDIAVMLTLSPADGLNLSDGMLFLAAYPDVPFTIQFDEALLTQLESDPALAEQFSLAAGTRPVLTGAGVDLDPSALAEIGQGRFYTQALETNRQRLIRIGLTPLPEVAMLSPALTVDGAKLLTASGVQAALSIATTDIETGSISADGAVVQIIEPDRALTQELSAPAGLANFSPSDIYALYARLSLRATDNQSSVILGGEGAPVLDSQSLDAFLGTLTEDGPLRPVPLIEAVASQPRNPLQAAERPEQNLLDSGESVAELQALAETSRSYRGVSNPSLDQLILDSLSRSRNPDDRTRAISRAKAELVEDFAAITLPGSQSLTLAAVEGPLPLTIRNDASSARLVRLEIRGDRVDIAENGQILTIPPGETVLELTATARALGVSTLNVTASTPDGERILSTSRYQIRSTAVPGLGWAISGTALLFLLVWWFRNSRRPAAPRKPHLVGLPTNPDPATDDRTVAAETAEAL